MRLLADIGGTNARFGLQSRQDAPIGHVDVVACERHDTLEEALRAFLAAHGDPRPTACAIAIATAVAGDRVAMTNHHWSFSIAELTQRMGFERLLVMNDFAALAMAIPLLSPGDLLQVGGGEPTSGCPIGVLGPGTGLGVSGLVPAPAAAPGAGGHWIALQGEGGHVTLAAHDEQEQAVVEWLRRAYGHASAERALSGPGLVNLYRALADLQRWPRPPADLDAARITALALEGDPRFGQALDLFCAFLGSTAGNLALTLGAQGGVYIGGGIVPRLGGWLQRSPFRRRFEMKGRLCAYLQPLPTYVICSPQSPALWGAARALDG